MALVRWDRHYLEVGYLQSFWCLHLKFKSEIFSHFILSFFSFGIKINAQLQCPHIVAHFSVVDKCKVLLFIITETSSIFQSLCSPTIIPLIIILLSLFILLYKSWQHYSKLKNCMLILTQTREDTKVMFNPLHGNPCQVLHQ